MAGYRRWLIETAQAVACELKLHSGGTRLKIRSPHGASETDTAGWAVQIGHLGGKDVALEIWLDRYSGHKEPRLSACFWSRSFPDIKMIVRHASSKLPPVRAITIQDAEQHGSNYVLSKRLMRAEFNAPIVETYEKKKSHFFGIYGPTNGAPGIARTRFCALAVKFFQEVARMQPRARAADEQDDVYPRSENRKWVAVHLGRERSGYLAAECKSRDGYRCQVCEMTFAESYGEELGADFAEAHHLTPLGGQPARVKSRLEDLLTVCANCHRMLHRMEGKRDDVRKLRAIVGSRRGKRK